MTDVHAPLTQGVFAAWTHTFCGLPWSKDLKVNFTNKRVTCVACKTARAASIARDRGRAA